MTTKSPIGRLGTGWARWLIWSLLVPLLILISEAGSAWAHAVVSGTEPADGAVLAEPPPEVVVRFNEPVSLVRAQVLGPDGQDLLASGTARSGEDGLHLPMPEGMPEGTYTVSYHVMSLDGHPVAGSLVFSLGTVSGASTGAAEDGRGWLWAFVAARVALYLGLFGAVGGVAYSRLVEPDGAARRIVAASALLGLLTAVAALGLQGGLLLGGSVAVLGDPATWQAGAGSIFGRTALCAMLGLALVWAGSRGPRTAGRDLLSLGGAALALGSFALSGHVVTAGPRWLTSPPLLLHASAAAFWVGSLLPLHRALGRPAGEAARLMERFSRLAVWAVAVLVLAGAAMAWWQVRRPEAMVSTEYGWLLLAKLLLVAGLLGLAALNRLCFTAALARGESDAARWFGRSVLAEIGLVVAILVTTAVMGTTPPPRALNAQDLHAHEEHGHQHGGSGLAIAGDGFEAEVGLDPGHVGANEATISLRDTEGRPFEALEVMLRLSNPGRGVAALERPALMDDTGVWLARDLVLGLPGRWEVEIDVLVSDFERQTMRGEVEVK